MSENRHEYLERQKKNVKVWSEEIEKFLAKADKLDSKMSEKFRKHIEVLKEKNAQFEVSLGDIQRSGQEGWEDLKSGSEKIFKALDKSFKSAKDYFH